MNRPHGPSAWLALAAIVIGSMLAGCAGSGGPTPAPSPHSPGSPGPVTSPAYGLPVATCGRASTHLLDDKTQIFVADRGALTCFASAARRCKAASIEVTEIGIDAGTNHVIEIAGAGTPCLVTEWSQFFSANPGGGSYGPPGSVACRLSGVTAAGVTLSCAGQRLLIPVAVTHGVSEP